MACTAVQRDQLLRALAGGVWDEVGAAAPPLFGKHCSRAAWLQRAGGFLRPRSPLPLAGTGVPTLQRVRRAAQSSPHGIQPKPRPERRVASAKRTSP